MSLELKYFKIEEFACPCCGLNNMDPWHLEHLDDARTMAGVPFVINSGCRCVQHNKEVEGKPKSAHLLHDDGFCYGSDILVKDDYCRYQIQRGLLIAGFRRLGVYDTWIHADNDPTKNARRLWL